MRLDKMTLAALEATLRLYLNGSAYKSIPTLRMLNATPGEMREAADMLAKAIEDRVPQDCIRVSVVEETEKAGGGSLPTLDLPGAAVRIDYLIGNANDCERCMANRTNTPVLARTKHEGTLFDVRCLLPGDECVIAAALAEYFESLGSKRSL